MKGQKELSCGLGRWRPEFLQKFATLKCFMIVYGLLGTIQTMAFAYFIATLTTMEKRFQLRSEVTGILMTGNEMSQILLSIFLAYRGGKGNRTVWMAWGVLFSSLSCFILALPHFLYGPGVSALALTEEYFDHGVLNSSANSKVTAAIVEADFLVLACFPCLHDRVHRFHFSLKRTKIMYQVLHTKHKALCQDRKMTAEREECNEENMEKPLFSLCLIFFSQFVLGVGTTLYVTLGQPYLDDNSKKKNTPKLLGLTMALRTAGPALGFVLGFLCLNIYVDPSLVPVIERNDPRWLGAWWLGWVILGTVMTIFSLLIASFPRQLRHTAVKADPNGQASCLYESVATGNTKLPTDTGNAAPDAVLVKDRHPQGGEDFFMDFKNALKRVCSNSLLICNIFTAVFYILGASGYINFYTKYSESQFHQSAALSSMIAGVSTVVSMVIGFITSGFIISKFKPKEQILLLFNVLIAVVYMSGEVAFMFLDCDEDTLQGNLTDTGMLDPNSRCNANCSCHLINYSPVCFEKGKKTFFSACHAGCTEVWNDTQMTYGNCTCLPDPSDSVKLGPCKVNCTFNFIVFIAVQCLIHLIGCSGRITNVLINYRCVEPGDKPLAQGIALFMVSLAAFIPGPIVYGRVIDSTCKIWDDKCGKRGNCWVYDKKAFRTHLNITALCFTFGAFVFDIVVYILGRNIKLYEEAATKNKT